MPSLADIARLAGVSTWTVSIALRDKPGVSPEVRARIKAIADEYQYTPRRTAKPPVDDPHTLVGVITHSDIGPFVTDILQGAIGQANHDRLHLVVLQVRIEDAPHYRLAVRDLITTGVKGILLINGKTEPLPHELLMSMWSGGVYPVVMQHAYFVSPCDRVVIQHRDVFRLAAGYLASLRHRDIACISYPGMQTYLDGFAGELEAHGLRLTASAFVNESDVTGAFDRLRSGGERFTALCLQDVWAWQVLARINELGMRVPEDFSLLGMASIYDGDFIPQLTTIEQFPRRIGREAIILLNQRLSEACHPREVRPRTITIKPELVIRRSCGPTRA